MMTKHNKLNYLFFLLFLMSFILAQAQTADDCPFCDLRGKSFAGKDLTDSNFSGAILDGADFSNATLNGAMFANASLTNVNFTNAKIDVSSYGPANFSSSNLTSADFTNASLTGAIFSYSNVTGTDFSGADLTDAKPGLELVVNITSEKSIPTYKKTKLSCEFKRFKNILDLSSAIFSACDETLYKSVHTTLTKIEKIESPSDPSLPTKVLMSSLDAIHKTEKENGEKLKKELIEKNILATNDTIYVSSSGTDGAGCGSLGTPCQTIGQAVTLVNPNGLIAVEYGKYPLAATISITKNIILQGGYTSGKPSSYQSLVVAPSNGLPAFNVTGSGVNTAFTNFIINGSIASTVNLPSIALQVTNSATLKIENVNVNAAKGGQGAKGAVPAVGTDGGAGSVGKNGTGGAGGTSACGNNAGGVGGNQSTEASSACKCSTLCLECTSESSIHSYTGGSGGPGTTGSYTAGSSGAGGINYLCPQTKRPGNASNGNTGGPAACGGSGVVSANIKGGFSGLTWAPAIGGSGITGGSGAGGGGGGSGGTCHFCNCVCGGSGDFYNGTAGGGGGAGGCGAAGGGGGAQGGASFGIVLQNANITVDTTVKITSGAGGNGGAGGSGSAGGKGGAGGSAQASSNVCNDTGSQGGAGGTGGAGGASGGGAGGNGGPSIGIAQIGTCTISGTPTYYLGVSGTIGIGGPGGTPTTGSTCNGGNGANGVMGQVANTVQF